MSEGLLMGVVAALRWGMVYFEAKWRGRLSEMSMSAYCIRVHPLSPQKARIQIYNYTFKSRVSLSTKTTFKLPSQNI